MKLCFKMCYFLLLFQKSQAFCYQTYSFVLKFHLITQQFLLLGIARFGFAPPTQDILANTLQFF